MSRRQKMDLVLSTKTALWPNPRGHARRQRSGPSRSNSSHPISPGRTPSFTLSWGEGREAVRISLRFYAALRRFSPVIATSSSRHVATKS
jgi:hypothetical protein